MRTLLLLLALMGHTFSLLAQQYNYFEGFTNLPVQIDTTLPNNLWEIGEPETLAFDTAFSAPNVIVTDLDSAYTSGTLSRFTATLQLDGSLWGWPYVMFFVWHKMEVDTAHAGGWIEISYNGGQQWNNIYDTLIFPLFVLDYSPRDTLFNGEIGFATNQNQWRLSTLCWAPSANIPAMPDSIMLRFNFAADSLASPAEGWMIDNLEAYPEFIHTIEDLRHLGTGEAIILFPNPMQDELNLFYRIEERADIQLQILNLQGQVLLQQNLGVQPRGIFLHTLGPEDTQRIEDYFIVRLRAGERAFYQKALRKR